jgi:hypothetical protein
LGFSFDLLKIQKKGVPKELPPKRVRLEWTWSSVEMLSNNHTCALAELWYILITITFMTSCQDDHGFLLSWNFQSSINLSKETLPVDLIYSSWLYKGSHERLCALKVLVALAHLKRAWLKLLVHWLCCKCCKSHKTHHHDLEQYQIMSF